MKTKKPNNEADIKNKNIGTKGTNVTSAKSEGNRSKQLQASKIKPVAKAEPKTVSNKPISNDKKKKGH